MQKPNSNLLTSITSSRGANIKKMILTLLVCLIGTLVVQAQDKKVSGVVTDNLSSPLIGVSVTIKNTTTGTVTDFDGRYTLNAKEGDVLEFSFVGMVTQQITVGKQTIVNVQLEENVQMLTETVVIGYGSAKMKDLTSPITSIKGDELLTRTTASPMQGLQGKVAGIRIVNSGQPGTAPRVTIRGAGSLDGSKQGPLYVVDGMFFDDISFLNSTDIETMNVLKDASSAAIYGVRAANGVIIITTKSGITNSKPTITYDGYVGVQTATNKMKMANASDYTMMMREAGITSNIDKAIELYGGTDGIPNANTDWYKELMKNSLMHSHSLNVAGGADNVKYVVGTNYLKQDGIMKIAENDFERINVRAKVDVSLLKNLKVGANILMTNSTKNRANEQAWWYAFIAPPIMPAYDANNIVDYGDGKKGTSTNNYASPKQIGYDEYFGNPLATAEFKRNRVKGFQVLPSFYADLSLLDDKLNIKSTFSQTINNEKETTFEPQYRVSDTQRKASSYLKLGRKEFNNAILDNVVTYRDSFGKHNLTLMAGNSIRSEWADYQWGSGENVPDAEHLWHLDQADKASRISGSSATKFRGASFFGRALYNYDSRYLLSATFRADGSSKYQEKWGYFPSIGLGWVPTEEAFFKEQKIFEHLKIRGSWGKLGHDKIEPNYAFAKVTQSLDTSGVFDDVLISGNTSVSYFDFIKWEVNEEFNIGFDFATLSGRLSGEFDYYKRKTTNAVFDMPLPFGAGEKRMNNGEVENSGVELTLNWNDAIGKDFRYNIGFNMSTLKNKVTYLNGRDRIATGEAEFRTYRILGESIDSFYGYKVVGVYQNQAQIDADPIAKANNLQPGDFMYADLDGDGELTYKDRQVIGSKLPKFSLGGSLGFEYKNIDFNLAYSGQFGHKIANKKRGLRRWQSGINFDQDLVDNRWTGEGSTNKYPSARGLTDPWNNAKFSSFWVESANTFTIENIQLGYTFRNIFPQSDRKSSLRISFTADRPFSFFSYNGFTTDVGEQIDAEKGTVSKAAGIDQQTYPLASTFSFGVRLTY